MLSSISMFLKRVGRVALEARIFVLLFICFLCVFALTLQIYEFHETHGSNENRNRWGLWPWASRLDDARFQNRSRQLCKCRVKTVDATSQRYYMSPLIQLEYRTANQSTCSDEATDAGPGQKVLSYSLFLKSQQPSERRRSTAAFLEGVKLNLDGIHAHYHPDWKMRLYSNLPPNYSDRTCDLVCNHSDLYWCQVTHIPQLGDMSGMVGRTWRFLPLADPLVETFVSRDLDSDISGREWGAVAEWLTLKYPFHIMRDNQHHAEYPVLAGMWGLRLALLPAQQRETLKNSIFEESKMLGAEAGKYADQGILAKYIAPLRNLTLAHDSFFCANANLRVGLTLPFNTQLDIPCHYVGGIRHDRCYRKHCPQECRPSYGKHWIHC